jgi:hypothetical protein
MNQLRGRIRYPIRDTVASLIDAGIVLLNGSKKRFGKRTVVININNPIIAIKLILLVISVC